MVGFSLSLSLQSYTTNSAKVVFLNQRPQTRNFRGSGNFCGTCDRSLQDPYHFCSLSCKVPLFVTPIFSLSPTLSLLLLLLFLLFHHVTFFITIFCSLMQCLMFCLFPETFSFHALTDQLSRPNNGLSLQLSLRVQLPATTGIWTRRRIDDP